MAAAAVDPIQDILDENLEMSEFFEIEAQVDDAEQRSKVIKGGFWDLPDPQTKTVEFAQQVCKVIRAQGGSHDATNVSVFTEMGLSRLIQCCVYIYMVQRPLDYAAINQDHLVRTSEWFDSLKEAKDDTAVAKYTAGCDKRV
jgi:hypothetical protein